jgi:LuxR family maltose regulon positive regulatory protein
MSGNLLQTKLYVPRPRPSLVPRPHLIEKLNSGLHRKLTLISAPAGFGKTTLVSEWIAGCERPFAWLSLDDGDADLARFLTYFITALQTLPLSSAGGLEPALGERVLGMLQSSQLPPTESVLTSLINEIAAVSEEFALVLDDYHAVDNQAIDQALTFLLAYLPAHIHLVITTREDPNLALARLRVRGQLTELRTADLRFTTEETAVFLNEMMGLELSAANIAALEARTEGWIAGLQLAALSMQGRQEDAAGFITAFTGSHRFVLDYLVEEVLQQQPEHVQRFLLQTAVLNQLTGSLCNTLTGDTNGQEILESLERANLFLVPLDDERRWYRYHHLFAELLRQRLQQSADEYDVAALHIRASQWYEEHGLELEAFHHAAAANDVERAVRLIEGEGLPLYFRGEVAPVQRWLDALPEAEFRARPSLWVTYASALTMTGRLHDNIEEILQAAETALQNAAADDKTNDLLGQIAAIRAMLAVPKNQVETIITESHRALELLHPANAPMRTTTTWTLGYAYQVQGNRPAATRAYTETIAHSQKSGNIMTEIAATTCLGQIRETENQTHQAVESFRRILQLVGDPPWPAACEAYVGLARIHYQWNDVEAAEQYGQQGLALARQLENVDTPAACGVLLARVKLAQGDAAGALAALAEAGQFVQQHHFDHWLGAITAVRIQILLHQGNLTAAAQAAEDHDLPLSRARVHLAQNDPNAALALLEPLRRQAETRDWADEKLQVMVLQALAHQGAGESAGAAQVLAEVVALAAPAGLIRLFVDEGPPMAHLLYEALARGLEPGYVRQLLAAFPTAGSEPALSSPPPDVAAGFVEPLSDREKEVLQLIAEGLTNQEVANRLYLSLHTVKVHARNIYGKLGVKNRTQAVAKAKALGILTST